MNRDIFISGHSIAAARWQQAIPHALIAASGRGFGIGPNDLVWLSAELPDWRSRIADLVKQNGCSVVVLSLQPDQREAIAALELGARGYAHALAAPALLREVATVVRHGGLWVGGELISRLLAALQSRLPAASGDTLAGLSQREREVAQAVASGMSNKEAARRLGITERTVKAHLGAIFGKLDVRDRLQLALRVGAARMQAGAPPARPPETMSPPLSFGPMALAAGAA
ncbi:helix-turn-helix transcriptional regulator [Thauera linaloolentis]|uniref:LuxR family transcriptional regulator n=1 Tax=Thauera linaloolentis (strain DSM 12138 / JCM 21573 / CCUG 41526 / CIP 105981 / IAM 15112 / NBRC 102519 / 47Lol) TaxID=1123367 RepID=N6Y8R1_THAL4|nr:response regulator transcription factor [Thauera linaloolentis]ENO90716.1 LuxR family transcriptional regulator [Thauera linaloolentis 47Lol = DSM 12138]MCM8565624.1 response regulator transcription factor [Thauera linaloolentis]